MRAIASFVVLVLLLAGTTGAATTPAQRCQSAKNKAAGKYAACRLNAEAKFATTADGAARATALQKCLAQYASTWPGLETKAMAAGGACPSVGDQAAIQGFIDANTSALAAALAGGTLASCPGLAECQADLTTCEAAPRGQPFKTGQTTCWADFPVHAIPPPVLPGTVIPCEGTGQDGAFQAGLARAYVDNGDGTITDTNTGLMWEKLADDDSVHDKDTTYQRQFPVEIPISPGPGLPNAIRLELKMEALNGGSGFAGYRDWRVPSVNELLSITSWEPFGAVGGDPVFNTGCVPGCTVLTCSCPGGGPFWSSTRAGIGYLIVGDVGVAFGNGPFSPIAFANLRAVRGGSIMTTTTTTSPTPTTTTTPPPGVCCARPDSGGLAACTMLVSAAECESLTGGVGSVQSGVCRNDGTCGVPTAPGECCDTQPGGPCVVFSSGTRNLCSGPGAVFSASAVCTVTGCQ